MSEQFEQEIGQSPYFETLARGVIGAKKGESRKTERSGDRDSEMIAIKSSRRRTQQVSKSSKRSPEVRRVATTQKLFGTSEK